MHGLASEDFIRGCHQGIELESRNARRRWALRAGFGGVEPKVDEDALRGFRRRPAPRASAASAGVTAIERRGRGARVGAGRGVRGRGGARHTVRARRARSRAGKEGSEGL